jgi:Rrf2 family protein
VDRIVAISDRANAAIHALALASLNEGSISANAAAERLGLSPSYLAKVLQSLAQTGLIASTRGIGGGFSLKAPAADMSCMDVLEALDGPLPERYCLFEKAVCTSRTCGLKTLCDRIEDAMLEALETTSIADVAKSF